MTKKCTALESTDKMFSNCSLHSVKLREIFGCINRGEYHISLLVGVSSTDLNQNVLLVGMIITADLLESIVDFSHLEMVKMIHAKI